MMEPSSANPQSFAVVGAGPVGCIVAAYLAKGGFMTPRTLKVTLNLYG